MKDRYIIDPNGKRRKIHYIPNLDSFGAHAWVRSGLFKKEHQYAAGIGVIDNLVNRLETKGWKRDFVENLSKTPIKSSVCAIEGEVKEADDAD